MGGWGRMNELEPKVAVPAVSGIWANTDSSRAMSLEETEKRKGVPTAEEKKTKKEAKKEKKSKKELLLEELTGVGEKTISALKEAGFKTLQDIAKASVEELVKVKGIGEKKAKKLIEEAKKLKN